MLRIETDIPTAVTTITIAVIAGLVAVTFQGCHEVEQTKREAFKAGLVLVPSNHTSEHVTPEHWVKPNQP